MSLTKIKSNIGNWAQSYYGSQNICYCGWMDLHIDEPYGRFNKGIWSLRVIDIDPDAVFVHRKGGVFVMEELNPEQIVHFRYDRWHGILPREVAKHLEGKRFWKTCKPYITWLEKELPETFKHGCSTSQDKARFLWEFLL